MSNVKLINSDDLKLYGCPVEDNLVIVAKQSRIKFQKEDVISSTQAEGIFHKIQDITYTGRKCIVNVLGYVMYTAFVLFNFAKQQVSRGKENSILLEDGILDRKI